MRQEVKFKPITMKLFAITNDIIIFTILKISNSYYEKQTTYFDFINFLYCVRVFSDRKRI